MNRKPACVHHWEIDRAVDVTSKGRCKLCGETRDFDNFLTLKRWANSRKDNYVPLREPQIVPGGHYYGLRLSPEEPV